MALLSRSSYMRKFTRKHDCSRACLALAEELSSAKMELKKQRNSIIFGFQKKTSLLIAS